MRIALVILLVVSAWPAWAPAASAEEGSIAGKVVDSHPPGKRAAVARDLNPDVCGSSGADESLVVGPGGAVKNAIVYLKDVTGGVPAVPVTASIDQKACTYVPHVLAVPVGSTLEILNSDPLLHNIHALAAGTTVFNYAMPMTVKKIPRKLTKPGFLTLKCDVHGWMNGAIGVMPNAYFAVTGADGSFRIDHVPPGTYTLAAWHETLHEQSQPVTVTSGGTTTATLSY